MITFVAPVSWNKNEDIIIIILFFVIWKVKYAHCQYNAKSVKSIKSEKQIYLSHLTPSPICLILLLQSDCCSFGTHISRPFSMLWDIYIYISQSIYIYRHTHIYTVNICVYIYIHSVKETYMNTSTHICMRFFLHTVLNLRCHWLYNLSLLYITPSRLLPGQ